MDKDMVIFYKLRTLEISVVGENNIGFEVFGMDVEDSKLIYGKMYVPYNKYLLRHADEFILVKDEAGNIAPQMKDEFKEQAKQFL